MAWIRTVNGFWKKKHIRQARAYAKETGGEFHKFKGKDGKNWASVSGGEHQPVIRYTDVDGNVSHNVSATIFKPGSDHADLLNGLGKNSSAIDLANSSGLDYLKVLATRADAAARGENGQPPALVKGAVGLNPLFSVPNSLNVLIKKKDFYGVDASGKGDQRLAVLNIVASTVGFAKIFGSLAKGMGSTASTAAGNVGAAVDEFNTVVQLASDTGVLEDMNAK
ncbi:hypothetical protein MKQ70_00040 [Chitinophaga sedimenti]|uniref:hypothetical protein n=1 Tax=Chitinophaga sedimenti TaxID=2033606 RepID=UPI0020052D4C|nr:hypothetical protein [Chitinophaga sedimenti]MCK7553477.1 hypothetical protein [Chitinophaga sedimenti]